MRICTKYRNFIIYLLLAVVLVAGEGTGLVDKKQVTASVFHTPNDSVTECSLVNGEDLASFQIIKGYQSLLNVNVTRYTRYNGNIKSGLLVLYALSTPADISKLNWESYILQGEQYVVRDPYQIVYMKNQDGRKRI